MNRAYFHAGRVLAVLALNGQIKKPFLRHEGRIIVMLGFIEFDQASPLDSENPDPLKLMFIARAVILFYTGVDTPSAPDAPGEIETISPESIGERLLRAYLKFLAVLLKVSLFEFRDDTLFFFGRHLLEMFLEEVFGFLFRTGREKRDGKPGQSGHGSISDKLSTGITLIAHFSIPLAGGGVAPVLSV
jgi:hypothetical protein